ncbi:hypothetical protein ABEF93_006428 [Exophiala dermatitidis]
MLLRRPVDVFRRCVQPWMPICNVTHPASWRSIFPSTQIASMVSVSGFKIGCNPHTSTHVLFGSRQECVAEVQMWRKPYTSIQEVFECSGKSATSPKPEHVSVIFWEDDEPADVAWTFPIRDGEDVLNTLTRYVGTMRRDAGDEYTDAFQRFVAGLVVKRLSLDQYEKILRNAVCGKSNDTHSEYPKRNPKTAVDSTKRLPGKARDEEIKLCFREGQSPLDLAIYLDRTPEFVLREAQRLLGEQELKHQMRRNKKGPWSDGETQWLISQRNEGLPLKKMARLLRRTKPNVEKELRQLGAEILETTVVEGPQEVPFWLRERLFIARLFEIWKGLLESDMTPTWREALAEKSAERWLNHISEGIPKDVKKVLGGVQPPTYDELERLSPVDSTDAGVYARLVTSRYPVQTASDRYLYVGSASKEGSGLTGRVSQHIKKNPRRRLDRNIRTLDLKAPGSFVTLMTKTMKSAEDGHILDVRRTVVLAEAILTIWLGALQSPCLHLQKLCPWDPQALDYTAWSSHNPLTVDIVLPSSPMTGRPV